MSKIEVVQSVAQTKQHLLDIQQFRMIGMFEKFANAKNIRDYFTALSRTKGYMWPFERKNGKLRFLGCDPEKLWIYNNDANDQFKWDVIVNIKMMLTDWHKKTEYRFYLYGQVDYSKPPKSFILELTKQQRGVLTKILKIENKRKRLLVR